MTPEKVRVPVRSMTPEDRNAYFAQKMRECRAKNVERFKQVDYAYRTAYPAKRLMQSTRATAKKRGIEHTIEESDIILPTHCPLLGIKLDYTAGHGKSMFNPSIDRIDPDKGYVKGNIEVMSVRANTMKCNAKKEELLRFAHNIIKRYENPSS